MLIFTMTTELLLKIHKSMLQLIPEKNTPETSESHSSKKIRSGGREEDREGALDFVFATTRTHRPPLIPASFSP